MGAVSQVAALSEVVICNMALSRIGIDVRISSINPPDQSKAAVNCAFWYPIVRDRMFSDAPWNFARFSIALAIDPTTTFPGWNYAYQYPSDCEFAAAVMPQGGLRLTSWTAWFYPDQFTGAPILATQKIPFQVIQNAAGTGKVILTDLANAYLYYIRNTPLPTLWDNNFTDAVAWDLAAELGGPMRADLKLVESARKQARAAKLHAMSTMMNEAQQDPERQANSTLIR